MPHSVDLSLMRRALALAARGGAWTAPNPMVGAVLAREGSVLAEGWHRRAGEAHAEVECLQAFAPGDVKGATLVVNLEPCSHHGKTPPCADLLNRHKLGRVVVAMEDPNPLVAGAGIRQLREAGIQVDVGLLAGQARWLNRHFLSVVERGRPWVTLKWAQGLDGAVASAQGVRSSISSPASRPAVLALRAAHPAILIGIGTALIDDPLLGIGDPGAEDTGSRPPDRIVLDSGLRLPADSLLVKSAHLAPLRVFCGSAVAPERVGALRMAGVDVRQHPQSERWELRQVLDSLLASGIDGVLVEGGPVIHAAFLEAGLVDEVVRIVAPVRHEGGPRAPGEDRLRETGLTPLLERPLGVDLWQAWRAGPGGGEV